MELWVRSQDKEELVKAERLSVYNKRIYINEYDENGYCIGIYATRERALEVLDEIQNILKPKYILDSSSIKLDGDSWTENGEILQKYTANARVEELSTYVYEMPQE